MRERPGRYGQSSVAAAAGPQRRWNWWAAVAGLLVILAVELIVPAARQAQTPDEANHMLGGARYWKYHDFGTNPEHPPLAKLVAALPLLEYACPPATPYAEFFKMENFNSGTLFLYGPRSGAAGSGQDAGWMRHDADAMLLRARGAVSIFAFVLGLLVLAAGCEMFGRRTGLLALALFVFEPNLLAHGSVVTTDMAATCCYLGVVYAFYRWRKRPTLLRLVVCGVAAGLALAAKHSAIALVPVLLVLATAEAFAAPQAEAGGGEARGRRVLRLGAGLVVVAFVAYAVLWGFYGFRYQARPAGMVMMPSLTSYAADTHAGWVQAVLPRLARWHALPEAYLFGLVDIVIASRRDPMFLLGTEYATGRWFYFPITFVIKSTLGMLALLAVSPLLKGLWGRANRREMVFLVVPPVLYFAVSLASTMDIGVRHILPVYPFLLLIAAASAVALARVGRWGVFVAALLVAGHVASSLLVFPNYLTYANEAWGGPRNTYRLLTDSNVDWGQGLRDAELYLHRNGIKDCWFAHYGWDVDPAYYQIPCRPLPEGLSHWFSQALPMIPSTIEGTVLVSATEANGDYWGPGDLNPYAGFLQRRPDAMIANSILVFHGRFDVAVLSALSHLSRSQQLAAAHQYDAALAEANAALALAPRSAEARAVLGNLLVMMDRNEEARQSFLQAVALARSDHPEFQMRRILHLPPAYAAP